VIPTFPRATAVRLLLIRTALLGGLLVFGAVTFYLRMQPSAATLPPDRARLLGYVFTAMAVGALAVLFVLRRRLEGGVTEQSALQTYIIGYAVAEGTALFGGATWFMGGHLNWYVAGLLLMVISFQILPIKRP
jgi:hypothetical protein